ncbi:MAG TPA: hypothetical protein DEQ38_12530 [Elusimicrobia bacterium]|nr:MAG: hypothetical protein A2089_02390 [Elusimicrobia bacterium GWD2_63_28]HCC48924.1 hypothetical protein [Elusimicrobiota bacterium]
MKKTSTFWKKFHKLHLGLYILFGLSVAFGNFTAFFFERYSMIDLDLMKSEMQHITDSKGAYSFSDATWIQIFRPVNFTGMRDPGPDGKPVKWGSENDGRGNLYVMLLVIWLWPLYKYYFSKKQQDLARIEKRIINLPLVLFILGWVIALHGYFSKVADYVVHYGPATGKVKLVFAVSALLVGTFVSYLNLELTGLYIRGRMAKPFFLANNPYGVKRGFAINLTLRYALMMFSLAMVPLFLSAYVPIFANLDFFAGLKAAGEAAGEDGAAQLLTYENLRVVAPIVLVGALVALLLVFQTLSILLYRYNVQAPVSALVKRMKAVANGDFSCKTSVLYADELGQLKGHFNQMLDGLVERDHIKDTFGRYVSLEIAEKIMKSGKVNLAGEEIQATVLFSDIRGFTPLSETMPPVELIRFLNEYFAYITNPIAENKGVINKFIGDAVMAIFSPVFGVKDHQEAAVRAALGMKAALKEFNAQKRHPEVFFGVGVHSGGLVAGNVGTEARLEYTVLGDTVNVASRIESQTKTAATEILLSEAVIRGIDQSRFPGTKFVEGEPVLMKGKSKPMILYKVETAA